MAVTCADCRRTFSTDDDFDEHDCAARDDEDEGGLPFETPDEFADPNPFEPDERGDEPGNVEEDVVTLSESSSTSTSPSTGCWSS